MVAFEFNVITIVIVSVAGQGPPIAYVITCEPTPAITGLKSPVAPFVIPVPDHVPPADAAANVTTPLDIQ